jgi:hypothetical protein
MVNKWQLMAAMLEMPEIGYAMWSCSVFMLPMEHTEILPLLSKLHTIYLNNHYLPSIDYPYHPLPLYT